ncbi:MAG: type III pantothenate kinase [Nitrosospira sp.]|nr:type III pantothenate kinase [Nitrosospira sp.]
MTYLMAIDSGNTRIKWGLHDGLAWFKQGVVLHDNRASLHQEWQDLPKPMHIIIANVAGAEAQVMLSELISCWKLQPEWMTATAYQCGVRNYYANPTLLGCDRWAGMIAAWKIQQQGCLVVNTGTAMTVDALSDTGEFLGGIIMPGLNLMQQTLTTHTALLKQEKGNFSDYPDNTADAIHSGAMQALVGAVERMATLLSVTLGHVPSCIISGGASHSLHSQLNVSAEIVDDLVLQGLVLIAMDNQKISTPTSINS